jgi:hypothetical protein
MSRCRIRIAPGGKAHDTKSVSWLPTTQRINRERGARGVLFQGRFFDRALRTVKEYHDKVDYIHLNPVRAGLADQPHDWRWSSVHDYTGTLEAPAGAGSPVPVDRYLLPSDPHEAHVRIGGAEACLTI